MIVILHNIRSLHNVGSIFRTADAVGIKKIYLCGITPAPVDKFGRLRQQLTKVSLGAEHYVEWEKVKAVSKLIDKLKKQKYKIFAIEQSKKSIPYYKLHTTYSASYAGGRLGNKKQPFPCCSGRVTGLQNQNLLLGF